MARAKSITRSRRAANQHYRNYQRGSIVLSHRLIASRLFIGEGEEVLVACSREEKDVVVDCLFWQFLQQ